MNTFWTLIGGVRTLYTAIFKSTGVSDAFKIISTGPDGLIDPTLIPGTDVYSKMASEDLSAGDFVNFHIASGVSKMRKADNSNGRRADGYVKEAILSGVVGYVFDGGVNTSLSGMTPDTRQYLGLVGARTETAPSASGSIIQFLGKSTIASEMPYEADDETHIA